MKKSRFTQAQITSVLAQAKAGVPVRELIRKHGISQGTFYAWRKKYGGMSASEATRLKQLAALERFTGRLLLRLELLEADLTPKPPSEQRDAER